MSHYSSVLAYESARLVGRICQNGHAKCDFEVGKINDAISQIKRFNGDGETYASVEFDIEINGGCHMARMLCWRDTDNLKLKPVSGDIYIDGEWFPADWLCKIDNQEIREKLKM